MTAAAVEKVEQETAKEMKAATEAESADEVVAATAAVEVLLQLLSS